MEVDLPRDTDSSTVSRPWASLDYSGFRLIFFLSLFATTAQQMRQTQNLYQVYELSGSALQLGLTGLAQGIPIFALGLFAGTLADFLDRKKLLLITIFGNCLVAGVQGLLTLSGAIQVWHILVGTALTSALNIVLNPTRMSLISRLVPRSHLTNAVSLNSSVSQSSFFFGPMAAGLTLAALSTGNAYLVNALFYVPAVIAILQLHPPAALDGRRERFSLVSILGGCQISFFRADRLRYGDVGLYHCRAWLLPPAATHLCKGYSSHWPYRLRHALLRAGCRRSFGYRHRSFFRRYRAQRTARPVVISFLCLGRGYLRHVHANGVVTRSSRFVGSGQFAAGGHAPDQFSSFDPRPLARPRLRRF